jgi:mannan endo-1,4-beta-mannosidase
VSLAGATVQSAIYVFVPSSGVSRVSFWVDNPSRSGSAFSTDSSGPFDLAGTASNGTAKPFDTRTLSEGSHSVAARVRHTDGTSETMSATFTVANGGVASSSLWNNSTTPAVSADPDTGSVELGVRFRADVNGSVTALRFYKGSQNTGTHVGSIWTATGTKLTSATFTGESASGWQQVSFPSPVAITAGATYIASYFAPNGHYSVDEGWFAGKGADGGPLHFPADAAGAPNGVYRYGPSGFPQASYNASNYWVDIVFTPSGSTTTTSGPTTTTSGPTTTTSGPTTTTSGPTTTTTRPATTTTTVPPTTTTTLGPPPPPSSGTGRFYIVGKDIVGPDGKKFLPMGANLGTSSSFQTLGTENWVSKVQAWGWNMIRPNSLFLRANDGNYGGAAEGNTTELAELDRIVANYTSQKIVVMLESHDKLFWDNYWGGWNSSLDQRFETAWKFLATRYKNNPYVWFNIANEPFWSESAQFVPWHQRFLAAIRSTGAENIVVADAVNAGQDAGWDGAKRLYDPTMGPALASGQCNVLFSLHSYGGIGNQTDYTNYLQTVQAQNLALIVGEFGYTTDGSSTAGTYAQNKAGADAVMNAYPSRGVGLLVWHGSWNDKYSLYSDNGTINRSNPGSGLSAMGTAFWQVSHNKPDLGTFSGSYRASNCLSAP